MIVDDHPLILSGIRALLEGQADLEVIGAVQTAQAALDAAKLYRPDLIIADGTLPDLSGITLIRRIREACPGILTLALTLHDEGPYVREFVKAGVNGFVLKRSAAEDLLHAVRAVLHGGTYIDPAVISKVCSILPDNEIRMDILSEREECVVRLVAEGFSNKEISRRLAVSVKTIETYRARACEKLDIHNRAALVRHALKEGWLAQNILPSDYTVATVTGGEGFHSFRVRPGPGAV